jgi:uncharacterized membrane protein YccC
MFMTMAITVMIAQLYVQLGEFSWRILLTRLAETAIGVVAVIIAVLFVVPLRPRRVLTTGILLWVRALRALLDAVLDGLSGKREPLRPLVREVDAAYAALVTTATSLRPVTFGRTPSQIAEILAVSAAARQYTRSLAALIEDAEPATYGPPAGDDAPLRAAAEQLRSSLQAIEDRLATGDNGEYVRSASLIALALDNLRRHRSPAVVELQDLTGLDGALARLATILQMRVTDHDTGQPTAATPVSDHRCQTEPSPT